MRCVTKEELPGRENYKLDDQAWAHYYSFPGLVARCIFSDQIGTSSPLPVAQLKLAEEGV
jgi:hypothetical protein